MPGHAYTTVSVEAGGQLVRWFFPSTTSVLGDQTQVIRLSSKNLYSLSHLASPKRDKNVMSLVLHGLSSLPFSYIGVYYYCGVGRGHIYLSVGEGRYHSMC